MMTSPSLSKCSCEGSSPVISRGAVSPNQITRLLPSQEHSAPANGFTLIELLVALLIFAMLASAGVTLLAGSVSAQSQVRARLDDDASLHRMSAILSADLAQAAPRISRTENGALAPAFFAAPPGQGMPLFHLVSGGRPNPDDAPRPTIQKVEYWFADGRLERRAYPLVDGTTVGAPLVLSERLLHATVAFRDPTGAWRSDWTPAQGDLLPRAVRLTLEGEGRRAPVTMLFLVGPGPAEKPIVAGAPGA